MNKKLYIQPTVKVVEIQQTQVICVSLTSVETNDLGNGDKLQYGDGDKKEADAWNDAW